jgi:hypothetical protein
MVNERRRNIAKQRGQKMRKIQRNWEEASVRKEKGREVSEEVDRYISRTT